MKISDVYWRLKKGALKLVIAATEICNFNFIKRDQICFGAVNKCLISDEISFNVVTEDYVERGLQYAKYLLSHLTQSNKPLIYISNDSFSFTLLLNDSF
jgi:hypothetical protein